MSMHTHLAYWVLSYIEQQSLWSSSPVNSRIGKGRGGGGLSIHSSLELVTFVVVLETQFFIAASEQLIHRTM